MLQMLRVVPPKIAFCCGNFSPGIMTPLASQEQAMYLSPGSYFDYFEDKDTKQLSPFKDISESVEGD